MSRFPENLRALRESRGLTQEALADRIEVAKSTVSMYESGKREPNFQTLEAIADCFNVSLSSLVGEMSARALLPEEARLLADYRALSGPAKRYVRQSVRLAKIACADANRDFWPEE